jgi:hypothetical protein
MLMQRVRGVLTHERRAKCHESTSRPLDGERAEIVGEAEGPME